MKQAENDATPAACHADRVTKAPGARKTRRPAGARGPWARRSRALVALTRELPAGVHPRVGS